MAVWGRSEMHTGLWWGNLKEKVLGRPRLQGGIILKWIIKKCDGGLYLIDLAEDRDRWRAFVNAVTNLRFQ